MVLVPETPDAQMVGDGSDIGRVVFVEKAAEELFCPLRFHRTWGRVDELKTG